ncbi:hypothetical protein ACQY0O_000197 [Thecaphora frezii]
MTVRNNLAAAHWGHSSFHATANPNETNETPTNRTHPARCCTTVHDRGRGGGATMCLLKATRAEWLDRTPRKGSERRAVAEAVAGVESRETPPEEEEGAESPPPVAPGDRDRGPDASRRRMCIPLMASSTPSCERLK